MSALTERAAGVRQRTFLVGLVGQGVAPSLTPPMHELEGARHGIPYVYRPIDLLPGEETPEALATLLQGARRIGFDGLNITHPVKQAVIPLLDDLSPAARRVGAVNTVRFGADGAVGHNTDVTGFGAAYDEAFGALRTDAGDPRERAVLLGAGGAGAALATALADDRVAELTILDEDAARAEALAARVAGGSATVRAGRLDRIAAHLDEADVVVHATPVGMAAHPGTPFDTDLLRPHHRVADIVYRPVETALLRAARERGCTVMSGLGMVMHQAADAFDIFTGRRADRGAMLRDLEALVAAESATSTTEKGQHP